MRTYKKHLIYQLKNPGFWILEILLILMGIQTKDSPMFIVCVFISLPFISAAISLLFGHKDIEKYKKQIEEPNELMDSFLNPINSNFNPGEIVYAPIGCSNNKVYKSYEECRKIILKEVEERQKEDDHHISQIELYFEHPEFIPYKKWTEISTDFWTNGHMEIYITKFEII